MADALAVAGAFAVAVALTWVTIVFAMRTRLVAIPDARSSHSQPTATMGGVAIVVPTLVWVAWFLPQFPIAAPLLWGGLIVALVGLADDVRKVPPAARLFVHVVAAALALWMLPITDLSLAGIAIPSGWLLWICCGLGLVWMLNLYNFMDGIDGLAATQCVTYGASIALLANSADPTIVFALVLASAALGFLVFNWAPARVFMGDVGSGFLGFVLGVVALDLAMRDVVPLAASTILLTPFWFDASYTLCARILTGQRFTAPHRSHAYQKIARRLGHGWTTAINALLTIVWLAPLALCAMRWPPFSPVAMAVAALPYAGICIGQRAGLPEGTER